MSHFDLIGWIVLQKSHHKVLYATRTRRSSVIHDCCFISIDPDSLIKTWAAIIPAAYDVVAHPLSRVVNPATISVIYRSRSNADEAQTRLGTIMRTRFFPFLTSFLVFHNNKTWKHAF